jgi:DNA-binding MarR family transcriptional regulator
MSLPSPQGPVQDDLVEALAHELSRHAKLLHAMRNQLSASALSGLDWGAFALLMTLVKGGPRRQGELAGLALLDPSTVSRHVGQLVRAGLVDRRPDPLDGRAVQLAASPSGEAMAREMIRRRVEMVGRALAGWQEDDVLTLVRLLGRLNDDLDSHRPQMLRQSLDSTTTTRTVDQER